MNPLPPLAPTAILRPERLLLDDQYHGGDQEWYQEEWHRRAGCGPTTAATLLYYLAQRDAGMQALWPTAPARTRADFQQLMDLIWRYVTPGLRGLNQSSMFVDGVKRYATERDVSLVAQALDIPETIGKRRHFARFRAFLLQGLAADCPVAFLNLSNGKVANLHSWHWVTIVAAPAAAHPEVTELPVVALDEGKTFAFDLRCWYETSLLGGALVWLDGQDTARQPILQANPPEEHLR